MEREKNKAKLMNEVDIVTKLPMDVPKRLYQNWFNENDSEIQSASAEKSVAHKNWLSDK